MHEHGPHDLKLKRVRVGWTDACPKTPEMYRVKFRQDGKHLLRVVANQGGVDPPVERLRILVHRQTVDSRLDDGFRGGGGLPEQNQRRQSADNCCNSHGPWMTGPRAVRFLYVFQHRFNE